ncbi:MAG: efflux RND transporter periplasmic adaptor subunit [Acidobacteria bacterium]|nr:efflux RND transporter periplasmic adaptor subunit [Acidobacteriota bacterium]
MRKSVVIGIVAVAALGAAYYGGLLPGSSSSEAPVADGAPQGQGGAGGRGGGGGQMRQGGGPPGMGGGFGGGGFRPPVTVRMAEATSGDIGAQLTVVGNLIGEQTVDVVPRTGGRLVSVNVKLGDAVRRGQLLAKIEDFEIIEQVKQAQASMEVAKATIRQREADLKVAELNFDRSKNLYGRQLLAKQALDDAESRYLAAQAQLDLARAQSSQTAARLDELQINLGNTRITSPVEGFVGRRNADPGAWVSQNAPVVSVVEIARLRLQAAVVEKDLRFVGIGDPAVVEVDAYPGDKFNGRVARVSPVLDPATRTATMEVEIPNTGNRLRPGMYARVQLIIEEHEGVVVVPKLAVVDFEGKRGVWQPGDDNKAQFLPVTLGIEDGERVEIAAGLKVGDRFVTEGAGAVRRNDTLVVPGQGGGPGQGRGGRPGGGGGQGRGQDQGPGAPGRGQGQPGGAERPGGGTAPPEGGVPQGGTARQRPQ